MRPELFDIFDDYVDDYCDPAPQSALPNFYHAQGSVNFKRLPLYPEYEFVFDQAVDKSAGLDSYGYAPVAQEMLIKLSWPRMFQADKVALETFYKDVVKGMARTFTYSNNLFGPALPVRFAAPLPIMPEVAYQQYRVDLTLRVALNYPQMTATGNPPAVTGNRFMIGSVVLQLPRPIKGDSGSGMTKAQAAGRDSGGDLVIYDQSRLIHRQHRLSIIHDYDVFLKLQAFFFTFVHGAGNRFTWVDHNEVSRTVRLASPSVSVKQLAYDRFQTDLNLIEEIAA